MDIKELPSDDPNTKAWITSTGTKIACRQIPAERQERNFHIEAKFEVGTSDEEPVRFGGQDREGIAHLGEHTPYLGTETHPGSWAIPRLVESLNGEWNAWTSRDRTAYWLHVPKEHAELSAKIIAELIRHPSPDPVVLNRELNVVDTERATTSPLSCDVYGLNQLVRGDNPHGYPVIGTQESILATKYDDIVRFRDRTYRSGRLAFATEGELPHEQQLEYIFRALEIAQKDSQLAEGIREKKLRPELSSSGLLIDSDAKSEVTAQTFNFQITAPRDNFANLVHQAAWGLFHYGSDAFSWNEIRVNRGMIYGFSNGVWLERDAGNCYASYDTFPRFANELRNLFAKELNGLHERPDFYRGRLALVNGRSIYFTQDNHQKNPFYDTDKLTDNLLFNSSIPHREFWLEGMKRMKFDDVIAVIDEIQKRPPSVKLRGVIEQSPSYDEIVEAFQPSATTRSRAAQFLQAGAGPRPPGS